MDPNTPHLPYDGQRARRGSSSFDPTMSKSSVRNIAISDWLQAGSLVVAAGIVWIALYLSR